MQNLSLFLLLGINYSLYIVEKIHKLQLIKHENLSKNH